MPSIVTFTNVLAGEFEGNTQRNDDIQRNEVRTFEQIQKRIKVRANRPKVKIFKLLTCIRKHLNRKY